MKVAYLSLRKHRVGSIAIDQEIDREGSNMSNTVDGARKDFELLQNELQRLRDEVQLKVHLGSKELQDVFTQTKNKAAQLQRQAQNASETALEELKLRMLQTKEQFEAIRQKLIH